MKTMAVFLGLMTTGVLVVMLYLWSGESLVVLVLTLITILTALWLFQRRPWESTALASADRTTTNRSSSQTFRKDSNDAISSRGAAKPDLASTLAPKFDDEAKPPPPPKQQEAPEATKDFFNSTAELNERSKWLAEADEPGGEPSPPPPTGEPIDSVSGPPEATPLNQAASHLKERVFGRKTAVFDLEAKEDDDKLWWDGHVDAEQRTKHSVDSLGSPVANGDGSTSQEPEPKPELDEPQPIPKTAPPALSKTSDSNRYQPRSAERKPIRRTTKHTRPPAGGLRVTGKRELPLPSSSSSPGPSAIAPVGLQFPPVTRTDTIELKKQTSSPPAPKLLSEPTSTPSSRVPDNLAAEKDYQPGPDVHAEAQAEVVNGPDHQTEPVITEVRPARASYDITCNQKGLSGVPENQQAPQLWAWQQIDDMALDVHPSTGLMTLRLSFPNLRDPKEPSYAWVEFGLEQDPDLVMDEARAGWRVSKIPRSQFYRLSLSERARQLSTFLTATEVPVPTESNDPNEIFDQIRTALLELGGLTRLAANAGLVDVMNQFDRLIIDNKVEPLTSEERAELESLGHASTLPELYWSLDWFMEQRGKRIAFIDEHHRDYLFGLIPAHLADHWDGQTVGDGSATVILDIP